MTLPPHLLVAVQVEPPTSLRDLFSRLCNQIEDAIANKRQEHVPLDDAAFVALKKATGISPEIEEAIDRTLVGG